MSSARSTHGPSPIGSLPDHVTGNVDYLIHVEVADLGAYEEFHAQRLAGLPGVSTVNSYAVMKTMPAAQD